MTTVVVASEATATAASPATNAQVPACGQKTVVGCGKLDSDLASILFEMRKIGETGM